uniref:Uncharacterized protein n=1 Tax=Quercus lobata TaxID=97700 RepID=A0A7N2L8B3_QUELO
MNYRAWNHRCWLVSYMTREQEELNWNERLIKRYIGREALWLHRRFLSLCWMKQFATNLHDVSCHSELKISTSNNFNSFIDNELHLFNSCSIVPENDFEDFRAKSEDYAEQGVPRKVIPLGFFNRLDGNA